MSPQEQIDQLKQELAELRDEIASLRSAPEYDPQVARGIAQAILIESDEAVTDYDQPVSEGGGSSYNVPMQFDGFKEVDGVLIGYYEIS